MHTRKLPVLMYAYVYVCVCMYACMYVVIHCPHAHHKCACEQIHKVKIASVDHMLTLNQNQLKPEGMLFEAQADLEEILL